MSCPLPLGFRAAGVHCGIKADPAALDLAVFCTDRPAAAAGVFTTNRVCGAPVKVSRARVPQAAARGVVVNSGNANACTGERGLADALRMTACLAEQIGAQAEQALVCSTGVIGRYLPLANVENGIREAARSLGTEAGHFLSAARAMMTTDTVPKQASRTIALREGRATVSGCAKGAAMIAPNMATMLALILTDAALSPAAADRMLRAAVDPTFNSITVDGHTSTSDTVLFLANGAAVHALSPADEAELQAAVTAVARDLAIQIIDDAEGATHSITIEVTGARDAGEARRIARTVADSPLVKTAIHGGDPNWGRIVSAVGYAGCPVEEQEISLTVNGMLLFQSGRPVPFDPQAASRALKASRQTRVEIALTRGAGEARLWTSDLTADYVRLNADYTT